MSALKDITENFGNLYLPKSALVFYESEKQDKDTYVEHYDIDTNGNPLNAHPLTVREARALTKGLLLKDEKENGFLKPVGIMPVSVLHLSHQNNGRVLWYTKAQKREMYFRDSLGIPCGEASTPALLWLADKNSLSIYALANDRRPTQRTPMYHAPFFNVYANGNVCMGTVDISIEKSVSLEEFITSWENYFFNSYFSHLMQGHNPIGKNCVNLWKKLVGTTLLFPKEVLVKTDRMLKNLLP